MFKKQKSKLFHDFLRFSIKTHETLASDHVIAAATAVSIASLLLLVFLSMLASLLCPCVPATLGVLDVLISAFSVVPAFQAPLLLLTPYFSKRPCHCQLVMNAGFPADA